MADKLARIQAAFNVTDEEVDRIADRFCQAMAAGLAGQFSPLKMLPSFLDKPQGSESGCYMALDFGGTNIRAVYVELLGGGQWRVVRKNSAPLKHLQGGYDYTGADTNAEELFDFIAEAIINTANPQRELLLGHTFSFPCRQLGINEALLINWTKEIRTAGVEGREVNRLLAESLNRQGGGGIKPCVVLNDTVGTLVTAAYDDPNADIGTICGTGHNTCYYDAERAMIINMESGNFDELPVTAYDRNLDELSEKPGQQRLEKMVAGRYLGALAGLIADDVFGAEFSRERITTEDLAAILNQQEGCFAAGEEWGLRQIAALVVRRSARLVAATFLGTVRFIDPLLTKQHTIAIDGSLYEKMPGYAGHIEATLNTATGKKTGQIKLRLTKDGSGIGAAIAAAIIARR